MNTKELFTKIIFEKCVKPVSQVSLNSSLILKVKFMDDTVVLHKVNREILHFLFIMQHVDFKKETVDYSIESPVGYYDIFGFVSKDTARFSKEGQELLISFL